LEIIELDFKKNLSIDERNIFINYVIGDWLKKLNIRIKIKKIKNVNNNNSGIIRNDNKSEIFII
jgi:hypothetical protein